MDKNLVVAIALSFLVYLGWFYYMEKNYKTAEPPSVPRSAQTFSQSTSQVQPGPSALAETLQAPLRRAAVPAWSERTVLGGGKAVVISRGAAFASFRFADPAGEVELVESATPGLFATNVGADFQKPTQGPSTPLSFTAALPRGLRLTKEFLPGTKNVLPRIRMSFANSSARALKTPAWTLSLGPGLGTTAGDAETNAKALRVAALTIPEPPSTRGKVLDFKQGLQAGAFQWMAVDNRYFLAAVLPAPIDLARIEVPEPAELLLTFKERIVPPRGETAWDIPYYLGSKGYIELSRYKEGLERSVNLGYFSQLAEFALKTLYACHRLTGNWGWAIILLTLLIQTLLFPMTLKTFKTQAAMRKLQPEVARLQQRYAKDPQKLQAEMMDLYRKEGANPLGGCLPMLVQIPVFYALYGALRNAWELHGAAWIWWIRDLSAKDPYYVLPVVMGGLMFLQNRMGQQLPDPAQARMMKWMPVIFTFMFLKLPSGLVLYWLTNSLATTLIQAGFRNKFAAAT